MTPFQNTAMSRHHSNSITKNQRNHEMHYFRRSIARTVCTVSLNEQGGTLCITEHNGISLHRFLERQVTMIIA